MEKGKLLLKEEDFLEKAGKVAYYMQVSFFFIITIVLIFLFILLLLFETRILVQLILSCLIIPSILYISYIAYIYYLKLNNSISPIKIYENGIHFPSNFFGISYKFLLFENIAKIEYIRRKNNLIGFKIKLKNGKEYKRRYSSLIIGWGYNEIEVNNFKEIILYLENRLKIKIEKLPMDKIATFQELVS